MTARCVHATVGSAYRLAGSSVPVPQALIRVEGLVHMLCGTDLQLLGLAQLGLCLAKMKLDREQLQLAPSVAFLACRPTGLVARCRHNAYAALSIVP
jgi:hypothetical protein